jgi:septum formation protein
MTWLGVPFEVVASGVDESLYMADEPEELVAMLATAKAEKVTDKLQVTSDKLQDGFVVIGCDEVIALDNEVMGKPENKAEARRMISALQDRNHEAVTALCLINDLGEKLVEVEKTTVTFAAMSEVEIDRYIKTRDWEGVAGGYQILGAINPYVREIDGNITNVIGLPLGLLKDMLLRMGVEVEVDLERVIERETGKSV